MANANEKDWSFDKIRYLQSVRTNLAEMERSGEAVVEERSYFGPLPVIRLVKPTRLGRIIKVAKR